MLHHRESTISWRINAERFVLLGWGRAILLQFAHPLVAAGVAEHSSFRESGAAAVRRLHLTVKAMLALAFGDAPRRAAQNAKDFLRLRGQSLSLRRCS